MRAAKSSPLPRTSARAPSWTAWRKRPSTGASKLYVLDLKKDFVENYIFPTLKFGAKYEDYLLGTSFARPCIAKALADIAIKEGADAICHGCTGKGNDQVRFELTLKALCPIWPSLLPGVSGHQEP